jgi:two-component system response regulator WspF
VILRGLPEDFAGAVIVVQHLDAQFCAGMADWLGKQSRLPVRMAREDETPARGVVLLAGGDHHLLLHETGRLGFSAEPADYAYRPSIDLFFQSVGLNWPGPAVGALLTGMGRDGALGLKVMRNKGYTTIAQDEASSAVYSMPKAAAAIQAAQHILPLDRIAPKLVEWIANLAGERTHA